MGIKVKIINDDNHRHSHFLSENKILPQCALALESSSSFPKSFCLSKYIPVEPRKELLGVQKQADFGW